MCEIIGDLIQAVGVAIVLGSQIVFFYRVRKE